MCAIRLQEPEVTILTGRVSMNVVHREESVHSVGIQLPVPFQNEVEMINECYAGLLCYLLSKPDEDGSAAGISEWIVGSLRRDNHFGTLGLERVDCVFHVFEESEHGLSGEGATR